MEMYVIDSQTGVKIDVEVVNGRLYYSFAVDPSEQEVNDDAVYVLKLCEDSKEHILKTLEVNKDKEYNYWFFVSNCVSFIVDYDAETYDCDGEMVEIECIGIANCGYCVFHQKCKYD